MNLRKLYIGESGAERTPNSLTPIHLDTASILRLLECGFAALQLLERLNFVHTNHLFYIAVIKLE
ncbi:unnamed protein product [Clavelina lepadiformis]|uniref:Uncharacterized protein n=1 Tax=Clavelina lepadiformis TaxID=159417 RepID=A0ABP0GE41_CLALP